MAKVLIVEDDRTMRDLYVELLVAEKHDVTALEDGEQAYENMSKGGYDLVLLDHKLPKMDGVEVLKKLKNEHPEAQNGAILVLTNLGQDSVIADAIAHGAKGYLIKADYTPEKLLEEINRHLPTVTTTSSTI